MSTTSINAIECREGRSVGKTLISCLRYGKNPKKTMDGELVTAFGCEIDTAYAEMLFVQKEYELATGKKVDDVCGVDVSTGEVKTAPVLYVLMQSFAIGEVDGKTAHEIGVKLAQEYLGNNFQFTVNTHTDKKHIHNHIYFNSVAIDAKSKFNNSKFEVKKIRYINDKLCKEYGLSVVVPGEERRSQKYSKCASTSYREVLRNDIDMNLKAAKNYDNFIELMKQNYIVVTTGKHLKFKSMTNGQERYIRAYSLGNEYCEESIRKSFLQNRVPTKKVKMSFLQKLKAKTQLQQNKIINKSQRLQNVKALFFTLNIISKNSITDYKGIINCVNDIIKTTDKINLSLRDIELEIKSISEIITAIDIFNEYKQIDNEYEKVLLKDRFHKTHEYELDLFHIAKQKLAHHNITPTIDTKQQLINAIDIAQKSEEKIKLQLSAVQADLDNVYLAKDIVDRLHDNKYILVSKKELLDRQR